MRRMWASVLGVVLLMLLGSASASAASDDAVAVVGSEDCTSRVLSSGPVDDVIVVTEHFWCTDEYSDPRVSGSWEADLVSVIDPETPDLATWTVEELVISNDGGTWRGSGHGVVDMGGKTALAGGVGPFNYGEVTLVGEGGYEGLRYHGYLAGSNNSLGLAGWVEPAE